MVSADSDDYGLNLVSPSFRAAEGTLLIAFVSADGPPAQNFQRVTSMTGGGLAWTLVSRSSRTWGTTEIWQAYSPSSSPGTQVTARLAIGYHGSITVASFAGTAGKVAASAATSGSKGAPTVSIVPTACSSSAWAVGHNWSRPVVPVPPAGQSVVHQFIDTSAGDSYWTQRVDGGVATGSAVTLSVSAGTSDRWSMAAVEIPGLGSAQR